VPTRASTDAPSGGRARDSAGRAASTLRAAGERAVALLLGITTVVGGLGARWIGRRPALPSVDYPKVFVVGCPRSGTTWVADILGQHPVVVRGRESQLFPSFRRSFDAFGTYNPLGWARLFYGVERGRRIGAMAGIHLYVDRATLARLGLGVVASTPRDEIPGRLVRAVLDTYFLATRGDTVTLLVEKTPTHLFYVDDILTTFPEAHVVEVVRDGRDVCVSMALRSRQVRGFPPTTEAQARLWVRAIEAGRAAADDPRWRRRFVTVRYEDLKAAPEAEIARLFAAVDLPATDALVREVAEVIDIARFVTGPGEFRHRGEVGNWVDHFDADDEATFRAVAGDTFVAAGYSFDSAD
jgi:hypothetical protein